MPRRTISGKRALVTGASGGLGKAIALELARQGARLVLLARREEKLRDVAEQAARLGPQAEIVVGDVTSPTIRAAALKTAQIAFGGLDILVNNAGIGAIGNFADGSPQTLRDVFETNFFAPAEFTREAIGLLKSGNDPIVVNIGSALGHVATPRDTEYCASKFALRGLSDALRAELFADGIDVLMVSPGPTGTDFWDHLVEQRTDVPWMTSRQVSADGAARRIVRAIAKGKREIFPSFRAWAAVTAGRLFPSATARFVRRYA